jgi:arylsulfatase A-like enzyme
MKERLNWKDVLGFGWRSGVVLGALVGFQEGFLSSTINSGPSTAVPLTAIPKLTQVFFTPIFAEAVGWGLILGTLALALYLIFARRFPLFRDEDRFVPFYTGLATAVVATVYIFLLFNPHVQLNLLVSPTKLFFNLRLVFAGLLIGVAVGLLAGRMRGRPSALKLKALLVALGFWIMLLTMPLLWVNRIYLKYDFTAMFFLTMASFLLGLLLLTWLTWRFLAARYQAGWRRSVLTRHQVTLALALLACCTFLPLIAKRAELNLAIGESTARQDLNVILVSVDTLRADRLSVFNPQGPQTPNIDKLAGDGAIFTCMQAHTPWTLPSLCTIHTSMYPTGHGVDSMQDRLDDLRVTLAETLSDAGLMTGAVVSNGWLLEAFGANQGFRFYDHMKHRLQTKYWTANLWFRFTSLFFPDTTARLDTSNSSMNVGYALEFLEANRENNFFFWLHVIDPHEPYIARGQWAADAARKYASTRIPALNSGNVVNFRKGILLQQVDRLHVEDLYNREVEFTDRQIGRVLDRVAEMGLLRNTMIIFTADHGEEFWEHRDVSHGHTYFNELVNVPMIIRLPDGYPVPRKRVETQVRLIDVAPTILDFLGLPPMEQAEGQSLLPLIQGAEEPANRPAFYESMIYYREQKGYCDGEFKYVLDEDTGEDQLFDLVRDPGETLNIAEDEPQRRLAMKGVLLDHLAHQRALYDALEKSDGTAELDEETKAHLRAMGYIQ